MSDDFVTDEGDPTAPQGKESAKRNRRDERAMLLVGIEFWVTDDGTPHASVPHPKGHLESMRIASREFESHLRIKNFQMYGDGISATALADLVALAAGKALAAGEVRATWHRTAEHNGEIWIDLGGRDPGGERDAVRITGEGWCITPAKDVPANFLRDKDALPLPKPVRGEAQWGDIRRVINVETDQDVVLLWAYLFAALRPFADGVGQYPIGLVHGEQGTGKSKALKILQALIDPSRLTGRVMPREPRDFWVSANRRHLIVYDNLSTISGQFADQIAPLATGGSYSARALHTDGEEFSITACRPMLFGGIPSGLLGRDDMRDRTIAFELKPLPKGERREEVEIFAEFEALHPALLGLLYDGLSAGLRNLPTTKLEVGPRMLDACTWAEACAPGVGIEPGEITRAWMANRAGADRAALDADDVAQAVVKLLQAQADLGLDNWKGSPTSLYDRLLDLAPEHVRKSTLWPKSAVGLGEKLRRIAPAMRAVNQVDMVSGKGGTNSSRFWFLKKTA
jgi:hypothetical protein